MRLTFLESILLNFELRVGTKPRPISDYCLFTLESDGIFDAISLEIFRFEGTLFFMLSCLCKTELFEVFLFKLYCLCKTEVFEASLCKFCCLGKAEMFEIFLFKLPYQTIFWPSSLTFVPWFLFLPFFWLSFFTVIWWSFFMILDD